MKEDVIRRARLSEPDPKVMEFLSSPDADRWIFNADILVDRAHVVMLCEKSIISKEEASKILEALSEIEKNPPDLSFYEDVHSAIESTLIEKIGEDIGGKMHTARSRNDEVSACIRIALRDELLSIMEKLNDLRESLIKKAESHKRTILPGFTHLQHAQPTTLAHHLLAHAEAFSRDFTRLMCAYAHTNMSPLGAAAFATTGFPIDREMTRELLGFDSLIENSMDAVSTRDFVIETISSLSNLMTNISRLAEEIILWSTSEFDFVEIDDTYASTSSIMPQKKNPDVAELVRARCGTVYGCLIAVLSINKALPYSYNRDLQEITPNLLNAVRITRASIEMMRGIVEGMKVKEEKMLLMAREGSIIATELADTLVREGKIPFRTAHRIVGEISRKGEIREKEIENLSRKYGVKREVLLETLDMMKNIEKRKVIGGPAPQETERMVGKKKRELENEKKIVREKIERVERATILLREKRYF
ncbi:MAG: argininosuccinate lyase [Candidatus Syntropharchaeia archaeon]